MSFSADEKLLEDIRRSVSDAIADVELSSKERNGVLLAIEEACTNVIRHAYLYAPGTIRIRIRKQPNQVVFSVLDKGRRFDFSRAGSPDLDRYVKTGRKGGLGLYLIRKMMDSVEYFSRDDENELRMVKRVAQVKRPVLRPQGISIRLKFSLWASLVVFAIIAVMFYYYDRRNSASVQERFFTEALNFAQTTALNMLDKMLVNNELELAGLASSASKGNPNLRYLAVVDTLGRIWADAHDAGKIMTLYHPPDGVDMSRLGEFQVVVDEELGRIYHLVMPIRQNDHLLGVVNFGFSHQALSQQLSRGRRIIVLFAVLGLVVGLVAVYMLSYYFVKPIQKLTEGVLKIGQGNMEEALPVEGSDEFSEIAKAFNEITMKFKAAQANILEQERLQKEMQVAQEIQHALLPGRFPEIEGYDLAAVYRAAKDVGGDYFDFVWIDDDTLGIIVADVSGKGVPGSLVMTMIRTAIRLEARGNKSPSDILARVNDFVAEDVKKGMFITIYFILLDSKKRQISFASAGHNPMILYRRDNDQCYFLNPKGMPLGLTLPDGISFRDSLEVGRLRLKKDDMLVIYTDGITEAMNNRGEQYGNDRLIEFIKKNAHLSPQEFASALDADLAAFTGNAPQNDDITLVVIKEQMMADELVFAKRRRLIEMVENEGVPIEEACRQMGVSVGTFYKYRKRWKEFGDAGLLDRRLRADEDIKRLSYTARKKLLGLVLEHPEYGAGKLQKLLAETGEPYSVRSVYEELVAMRLNTKSNRLAYVERMGTLKPEQKILLEKETLRQEREKQDRAQYAEYLRKSAEERRIEEVAQETGRVISQLRRLAPMDNGADLYTEIAKELEKLDGGVEMAALFQALVNKMRGQTEEPKAPPVESVKTAPTKMEPVVADQTAIDIEKQAIASQEALTPKEFEEYEKRLVERFRKG